MAKSPLMYGGDLRAIDDNTLSLITNPLLLDINAHSINNHEVSVLTLLNPITALECLVPFQIAQDLGLRCLLSLQVFTNALRFSCNTYSDNCHE